MGFFSPGYLKEGKGISKEQAERRNYFGTFFDKIFDMIKINALYFACNIPVLILCALIGIPLLGAENFAFYLEQITRGNIIMVFWMMLPLFPLVLSGPFTAGLTYITRNFVKREHSFLFSDFWEHSKKNIKQSIIANIIFYAMYMLYISVTLFYFLKGANVILMALLLVIGIVLLVVPFYVYLMIVSFDMKLKDIFKNAWIFALAKLPQNLFFLIIVSAVHITLVRFHGLWILFIPIILIAWTFFTMNYYAWYIINKNMISNTDNKEVITD
ncbi:MAG: DUF624 domain-containing protein [Ruminococcaceae bacterium]|nr:DUF624 domain-containing protein [Oscillospiraceae bacterium]